MNSVKRPEEHPTGTAQVEPLKPITVLLVEDELIVQRDLVEWLSENDLVVLTAETADEAIKLLNSHTEIDVLLTDIEMPGSMDGIRLAHFVKKRWPPIKIIVLSGRFHTQLSELPLNSLFIPKPYHPEALLEAISGATSKLKRGA
jgi:CheY-like chemotaxis protein